MDDEILAGGGDESDPQAAPSWLTGWNFVTELYKTLEHALDSPAGNRDLHIDSGTVTAAAFLDFLDTAYSSLPLAFKEIKPFTNDARQDRFGYQSANILVTLQTIRMVVVCRDLSDARQRDHAVQIAEALLRDVGAVPLAYLQAISSPLVRQRFSAVQRRTSLTIAAPSRRSITSSASTSSSFPSLSTP